MSNDNLDTTNVDDIQNIVDQFNDAQMSSSELLSKDTSVPHEMKKALAESYFVPAHEPRVASSLYNKTHDDMINVKNTPCFICGVSKSTLNDTNQNLYGATQLESHHFHCEWSLANQVDWSVMKTMHPDFPNWESVDPADPSTYFNFVDSEYNMMILCDVHHRAKYRGIHAIEYAVWIGQKFMNKSFKYISDVATKDLDDSKRFVDDLS